MIDQKSKVFRSRCPLYLRTCFSVRQNSVLQMNISICELAQNIFIISLLVFSNFCSEKILICSEYIFYFHLCFGKVFAFHLAWLLTFLIKPELRYLESQRKFCPHFKILSNFVFFLCLTFEIFSFQIHSCIFIQ